MPKFHTSGDQIAEIARREGFRAKTYRPIPGKDEKGNWRSNLTIGYGQEGALFPGTPGEIPVVEGLVIDERVAWDALCFFVYNVVDKIVSDNFNPQTQDEHDACSSFVYNTKTSRYGKPPSQGGYTLPHLVCQADRSPQAKQAIAECWLQYCLTPGAESGLGRRRVLELLEFNSLTAPPGIMGQIMAMRAIRLDKGEDASNAVYFHPNGKFALTADPFLLLEAASGLPRRTLTENEITADLNAAQLDKLRGTPQAPSAKPVAAKKPAPVSSPQPKPIEAPNVDLSAPPKPMEQSTTAKGMSHKDSGKETVAAATVTGTGVLAMLPYAEKIAAFAERTPPKAIFISLAALAAVFLVVGLIRWWYGRMQMYEGRQKATEAKI